MILEDVKWIRSYRHKLCPSLRKQALNWYKPLRYLPCFLQSSLRPMRQRFNKIPVIVETESTEKMGCSVEALASSSGCKVNKSLSIISCFSTTVDAKSLEKLAKNPHVKKVWLDSEVKALLDVASPTVDAPILWDSNITGENVVVAVLDTGIVNHPDLRGRIIASKDLIQGRTGTYDDNGHGTHVAGAIASNGSVSNGRFKGAAPKAKLVNVKVLNKIGSGSLSNVIEGVQWCIQSKDYYDIRVINLSLGVDTNSSYKDDPLCTAVGKAWELGIVVCAAAGNSGPNSRTIASPGIHPKIITVGATDDKRTVDPADDTMASFSSRGPTPDNNVKPDVVAPGTDIVSLSSEGSFNSKYNKGGKIDSYYTTMSGTSMACPLCAGVIAQILQVNPHLTPDQVKRILKDSAMPLRGVGENSQGAGVVKAVTAISLASRNTSRNPKEKKEIL